MKDDKLSEAIDDFGWKIKRWRKAYPRKVFPGPHTQDWIGGAEHVLKCLDESFDEVRRLNSAGKRQSKSTGRGK